MCESYKPCRRKTEQSAVLAQSTLVRFSPIGRQPASSGFMYNIKIMKGRLTNDIKWFRDYS